MADVKISQLPAATTPVDGTEVLPIVQSATTKQVSIANLTAGRAIAASSLTLTTPLAVTSGGTGLNTTGAGTFIVSGSANTISATATPTLGVQQTTQGTLTLANTAAGAWPVTIQSSNSATAAWTMTLPPAVAAGNGYILTSTTGGVTSWTNPTALGVDLDVGTTAITGGTTGRVLYNNAGVLGEYTVVPVGFGGTGTSTQFTAGSVVFAGASGIYSQKNANFFWDNTNNYLGLGTASPGYTLDVYGTGFRFYNSAGSANVIYIGANRSGDYCFMNLQGSPQAVDGYTVGGINAYSSLVSLGAQVGNIEWTKSGSGTDNKVTFQIRTNNGSGMDYLLFADANRNIRIYNSLGVGNTTPSTSGTGIAFPATQSASSDANTLDDYEEGSWTPAFGTTSTNYSSITYSTQTGVYTKVGNVVTLYGWLEISAVSGGTGNCTIGNLPFTTGFQGTLTNGWSNGAWNTQVPESGHILASNTVVYLIYYNTTGSTSQIASGNLKAGSQIIFSATYRV